MSRNPSSPPCPDPECRRLFREYEAIKLKYFEVGKKFGYFVEPSEKLQQESESFKKLMLEAYGRWSAYVFPFKTPEGKFLGKRHIPECSWPY